MKKPLIIFLLILSGLPAAGLFSQTPPDKSGSPLRSEKIDSLLQVLKNAKEDTTKIKTLINKEIGNKQGIAVSNINIGVIYTEQKQYDKAIERISEGLKLAKNIGHKEWMQLAYKSFTDLYVKQKNHKKALEYHQLYVQTKDSLFNEEKSKDIGRVEARHETEMQMMEEQAKVKAEADKIEKEKKRRNYWQYSAIFIVFVILFLSLFLLTRFHIPITVAEGIIFTVFLLFFEFILVLAEPWIEAISHGEPAIILACNAALAGMIFPFHSFFEAKVKERIVKQSAVGNRQLAKRKSNITKLTMLLMIAFTNSFYSYSPTYTESNFSKPMKFRKVIVKGALSFSNSDNQAKTQFVNRKSEIVNPTIDSLENMLKALSVGEGRGKNEISRLKILTRLILEYELTDPNKALQYGMEGLALAKRMANLPDAFLAKEGKIGVASCLNNMGLVHQAQGSYQKATDQFLYSLKIKKELFNSLPTGKDSEWIKHGIANSLINLGEVNRLQGNYDKAIDYDLQSLQNYEQLKESSFKALARSGQIGISNCWNNIAIIYYYQRNYEKTLDYFFQSIKIKEKLGNKRLIAENLGNIGVIYKIQGKIEKAMKYYMKCLTLRKQLGSTGGFSSILINIANIYTMQGKYKKALNYHFQALKITQQLGYKDQSALCLDNIGDIYSKQKYYKKAILYFHKGINIAKEIGSKIVLMDSYKHLSNTYAQLVEHPLAPITRAVAYKQAFEYHKLYAAIKDSLFNEEKSKEIGRLEEHYLIEKKIAKEKAKAKVEAVIKSEKKAQRHRLQFMGSFIVIVALLIVVFTLAGVYIPIGFAKILIFIIFVLLFEFILVLLDPMVDEFSGGAPAIKLAFNAMVAGMMYPLHRFLESKLKSMILKKKTKRT